jgi:hypothetical protein
MYLDNQSVPDTGLSELHVHDSALANGTDSPGSSAPRTGGQRWTLKRGFSSPFNKLTRLLIREVAVKPTDHTL